MDTSSACTFSADAVSCAIATIAMQLETRGGAA